MSNHSDLSPLHFSNELTQSTTHAVDFSRIKLKTVIPYAPKLLCIKQLYMEKQYQLLVGQTHSNQDKKSSQTLYLIWVTHTKQKETLIHLIKDQMRSWSCFQHKLDTFEDKTHFFYIYPLGNYQKLNLMELNHREQQLQDLRFRERPNQNKKTWTSKEYTQFIKSAEHLALLLVDLHAQNLCLGGFDPQDFIINSNALCQPLYPMRAYKTNQVLSLSQKESNTYLGYSPPESYGYFKARPTPASDVFSFGMWLFYSVTGSPLLSETRRPFNRLPSPHIYQPSLMPELVAVIRKATSSYPSRRYQNMSLLWDALCWAIHTSEQREDESRPSLHIEIGHEIHIGLLKGQYNPNNQDDLFLGYQPEKERSLFVVTDGVSISEYGSGDIASSYVRQEAYKIWHEISDSGSIDEHETLSELSIDLEQRDQLDHRPLVDMLNRANTKIGADINRQIPVFHGPPEGIMAATAVAVLVDKNKALLASIGDSRIYLIRNQHICSLMVDDDLLTHLIQMGQTPTQAQQTPSSAALINCVGEFKKNDKNQLQPVELKPQLSSLNLLPNDYLVLCSDGIPDYAGYDEEDAEQKIMKVVTESFSTARAAFELIVMANRGGGGDNLSCIVLHFSPLEENIS
jgi:serine/threonine protein phosphatase PrpC